MAKENKKGKKDIKLSDVKEATNASKDAALAFPSDAPNVEENKEAQGSAPVSAAETENVPTNPPEAPTTVEVEKAIEIVAENVVEAIEHIVDDNVTGMAPPSVPAPAPAPVPAAPKVLTQDEQEERYFEKWWNARNRPTEINHFELAQDINMNKFSAFEAIVGKFKFKRVSAGANWQITVIDKK